MWVFSCISCSQCHALTRAHTHTHTGAHAHTHTHMQQAKSSYPPYHVLSVMCIAYGAFMLGQGAAGTVVTVAVVVAKMHSITK